MKTKIPTFWLFCNELKSWNQNFVLQGYHSQGLSSHLVSSYTKQLFSVFPFHSIFFVHFPVFLIFLFLLFLSKNVPSYFLFFSNPTHPIFSFSSYDSYFYFPSNPPLSFSAFDFYSYISKTEKSFLKLAKNEKFYTKNIEFQHCFFFLSYFLSFLLSFLSLFFFPLCFLILLYSFSLFYKRNPSYLKR